MIIIVYSGTSADTVKSDLGKSNYSYYFILHKYLPILRELGDIRFVEDPQTEVDQIYSQALAAGNTAVFLSFSPPHQTASSLRCPTVCVMAWEFASIPDEDWDLGGTSLNWVRALRDIGNVITISDYATNVIRGQVGSGVRVVTIPAPVDAQHAPGDRRRGRLATRPPLVLGATVIDSRECEIDVERVTIGDLQQGGSSGRDAPWDGREASWTFVANGDAGDQYCYLSGFYAEEDWGAWSRTVDPAIILPWRVGGDFEIELTVVGYGENQGRSIGVSIGDCSRSLTLPRDMTSFTLQYSLDGGANSVNFSGLTAIPRPGARDHRTLAMGLKQLVVRPLGESQSSPREITQTVESGASGRSLQLDGTVYTSVFNPMDGRKNWKDIVSAFCWAFREDATKTLILKMSHHNKSVFLGGLLLLFSRLHPFSCRIVAVHGYLSDTELRDLVEATDFYVNASSAEGQCLPLLEFMVEGVPAIAPDHTAMETYISEENAFIVRSSLAPQAWLIDPRSAYRTTTQRISWDSLRQCFVDSAALLDNDPARYLKMAEAAAASVVSQYSSSRIRQDLYGFLAEVVRSQQP